MALRTSSSSMLLVGKRNEEDHVNQALNIQHDIPVVPPAHPQIVPPTEQRNRPVIQYPDVEVIALSPTTLMAEYGFVCEVCHKGFRRDQNLQLHKQIHKLPWKKLKQTNTKNEVKRKVYLCPEPSCGRHSPSRPLKDITGMKRHYSRKHGEKKYKCEKCSKMYAVKADLKAHSKICGKKEYQCYRDTLFSSSHETQRAFWTKGHEYPPTTISSINSCSQMRVSLPHEAPSNNYIHNLSCSSRPAIAPGGGLMIRPSLDMNYYKPSSAGQQINFDTTNMVMNNTYNPAQNLNLSFMGINYGNGTMPAQCSTYATSSSGGSGVSYSNMNELAVNYSFSSNSIFNPYEQEDSFHGALDSSRSGYYDESKTYKQHQPQNTDSNMYFQ